MQMESLYDGSVITISPSRTPKDPTKKFPKGLNILRIKMSHAVRVAKAARNNPHTCRAHLVTRSTNPYIFLLGSSRVISGGNLC